MNQNFAKISLMLPHHLLSTEQWSTLVRRYQVRISVIQLWMEHTAQFLSFFCVRKNNKVRNKKLLLWHLWASVSKWSSVKLLYTAAHTYGHATAMNCDNMKKLCWVKQPYLFYTNILQMISLRRLCPDRVVLIDGRSLLVTVMLETRGFPCRYTHDWHTGDGRERLVDIGLGVCLWVCE